MSRGRIYTKDEKERAKKLVEEGKPYREIKAMLGVPKSTLSAWYGKTIKRPVNRAAMLRHLEAIRALARIAIKNKYAKEREAQRQLIETRVTNELRSFPFDNTIVYKGLLAMLYWAEGSKHEKASGAKFVNTDPELALLYVTLLRKCYALDEKKFRVGLHLHYYHSPARVRTFWSKHLGIPATQFYKIYIKNGGAKRGDSERTLSEFALSTMRIVNYA